MGWNSSQPNDWAKALGLVWVPFFPAEPREDHWSGESAALLDGQESSFSMFCTNGQQLDRESRAVEWSWSACLRHIVVIDAKHGEIRLTRWDAEEGEYRRYRIPDTPGKARDLLTKIATAPAATRPDAVSFTLGVFRQLREALPAANAVEAVSLFNAFLVGVSEVRAGRLDAKSWSSCRTFEEALEALVDLRKHVKQEAGTDCVSRTSLAAPVGLLIDSFLAQEPLTGYDLEPQLLLRHASGQLYQEAHLVIARDDLIPFPGMASGGRPKGVGRRDVHFTPVPLARTLVEQAFEAIGADALARSSLEVLDPACGCGVFLQEALRELQSRHYHGQVNIRGIDISPISCAMARFCLSEAKREAERHGMRVAIAIDEEDAIGAEWGTPDLILTNPPFASWDSMDDSERNVVAAHLPGHTRSGDKAMVFAWLAVQALRPGAVLASVLPAPLFETQSGQEWREAMSGLAEPYLIGRFQSVGYFKTSTVEPGFAVFRRRDTRPDNRAVKMLVAREGGEEHALQALRRHETTRLPSGHERWDLYEAPPSVLSLVSWLPYSMSALRLVEALRDRRIPSAGELFEISQGALTGDNSTFVLSTREWRSLPEDEQKFFRPAAGTETIRDGRLRGSQHVFYPYDAAGLRLKSEEELRRAVPTYYENLLEPAKERLKTRKGRSGPEWWALNRPRPWQYRSRPKLVSKYFGVAGAFAFDDSGDYVVVQGHAWLWRQDSSSESQASFAASDLPCAYLALLNSSVFEAVLASVCPRVRGGQYNLSTRFVERALLPNIADETAASCEATADLARLGRQMQSGTMPDAVALSQVAARAYGISAGEAIRLGLA